MKYTYQIRDVLVEIVNPTPSMGISYKELEKTADTWANYAIEVSKPEVAESVTVLCDEHGVIKPRVVIRRAEA